MNNKQLVFILIVTLPTLLGCIQVTTVDGVKHCICHSNSDCVYGYDCRVNNLPTGCYDYKHKIVVPCKPTGMCVKKGLYGG